MSNKLILLWGFLMIFMSCALLIIGKNEEKIREKKEIETIYDNAVISYIEDNEIEFIDNEVKISSNDLLINGYINEVKMDDSICVFEATVLKKEDYNIKYKYECEVISD